MTTDCDVEINFSDLSHDASRQAKKRLCPGSLIGTDYAYTLMLSRSSPKKINRNGATVGLGMIVAVDDAGGADGNCYCVFSSCIGWLFNDLISKEIKVPQ